MADSDKTPILRADATDDDDLDDVEGEGEVSGKKYKFGGTAVVVPATEAVYIEPVCPICDLPVCGHNLPKVIKS